MNKDDFRTEVLELLARGKITIDEAVNLLDQPQSELADAAGSPLKVEVDEDGDPKVEDKSSPQFDVQLEVEDIPLPDKKAAARRPRWLRIYVGDLNTGKGKVKVNVPFGMVKFGLDIAQFFTPQEYRNDLGQIESLIAEADSGLLVDVQDVEKNEHVRVYFE